MQCHTDCSRTSQHEDRMVVVSCWRERAINRKEALATIERPESRTLLPFRVLTIHDRRPNNGQHYEKLSNKRIVEMLRLIVLQQPR